jgi:hypothetical protein
MFDSLKPPNVPVYIIGGVNLPTESSYMFQYSLINEPVRNYPMNSQFGPNNNQFLFPENFNGDGTIPRFALEFPLTWS